MSLRFPSSPMSHHREILDHEATSELGIPITLAVDFADEIEFSLAPKPESTATMSPAPSHASSEQMSPCSTSYLTTPPTSPMPAPQPDSEEGRDGQAWKGKARAIPTPSRPAFSATIDPASFQTPPDTTFGTSFASGSGSRSTEREERLRDEQLTSFIPLASSRSPSPDMELERTPRPSRVRAISTMSFTSFRESMNRRRSTTGTPSRSTSGTPTSETAPKRKLSLKGLGALVRRKTGSRSGLSSGTSTPVSFVTPASSLPRRALTVEERPSVLGVWDHHSHQPSLGANQNDQAKDGQETIGARPVRGRADTAPEDYFGLHFDSPHDIRKEEEDVLAEEVIREDVSEVVQVLNDKPTSPFGLLPRELQLLVLVHLVEEYREEYVKALRDGTWSVMKAGGEAGMWIGEAAGLRAVIGVGRVSKLWHTLSLSPSIWARLQYASLAPPRIGIPTQTHWLPQALRAQAKSASSPTVEELDAQDERVMRLIEAAGTCLRELNMRGCVRLGSGDVKRLLGWISAPSKIESAKPEIAAPSLLTLTRSASSPIRTTNLTSLVLTSCTRLSAAAVNALVAASPNLEKIELRALPGVTDETCSIIAKTCRGVRHLDIGRCANLGPGAVPALCSPSSPLPKLRTLLLSGYPYIDPSILSQLGETFGSTLETLDLAGVWGVTDAGLSAYVAIEPSEEEIEMGRFRDLERWARARLGHREGNGEEGESRFVTLTSREAGLDPTIRGPVYRRRTALRHLNLSHCRRLTDTGLGALAHAVPGLEVLELAGIGSAMAQPGLVRLFKTCPKIRKVDLEDAGVGDEVIEALTPAMDESDSDDTPEAEDDSTETIQISMHADCSQPGHALTHFVLSHCIHVTSRALAQLVRACPKLTVLALDGTSADDRVVRFFVCATRARAIKGAEVGATDTRFVARAGLPTSGIRPRRGVREWSSRGMAYVDSRDAHATSSEDECDESKVVVKTYWSWQAVDGVLERRRALLGSSSSGRRNTDGGSGIRSGGPRWGRHRHDERGGCVIM
ncbi:RNI-like protein [Ceratobasidium sp. AG-I]|nr:RNI-like protein [Ceratobasidium sp. AG-I]